MTKSIFALAPVVFLSLALGGCAGATTSDSSATADDSAALSAHGSSAKAAIKAAIGIFAGGEAKLSKTIEPGEAPAAVAPKLKSAYADMVRTLAKEDDFTDEKALDKGFYAVFASAHDHTIVGYAVWVYGDNGDAGWGLVRGFDPSGDAVYSHEDSWAED